MLKKIKAAFRAWWEKHIIGDVPHGYDIDANVVRGYQLREGKMPPPPAPVANRASVADCWMGHAHVEQVPEGELGKYIAQLDQKPAVQDPPMHNAHRRFAFCFLAEYQNGDRAVLDKMVWNVIDAKPLFLDPRTLGEEPSGYRWRSDDPYNPWTFSVALPPTFKCEVQPLFV